MAGKPTANAPRATLDDFARLFFNNTDPGARPLLRSPAPNDAGKDGTALNEAEMICDSLMNNDGILRSNTVIKYRPDESVVKLEIGGPIRLTAKDFDRRSAAYFEELKRSFL